MFKTKTIEVILNEIRCPLSVMSAGEGPTIFLIHGWNHSAMIWTKVIQKLAKSYKIVSIDLPGFGNSPPLPKELINIDNYSHLLDNLIKDIFQEQKIFMIVGDSFGAITALKMLSLNDTITDRLVLSGCPIDGLPPIIRILRMKGLISYSIRFIKNIPHLFSFNILKLLSLVTVHKLINVNDAIIQSILGTDPYTSEVLFDQLCSPNIRIDQDAYPSMKKVIIRGEYDHIVSRKSSKQLAKTLGGIYVEIPGVSHTPMVENSRGYIKAFSSVLN